MYSQKNVASNVALLAAYEQPPAPNSWVLKPLINRQSPWVVEKTKIAQNITNQCSEVKWNEMKCTAVQCSEVKWSEVNPNKKFAYPVHLNINEHI